MGNLAFDYPSDDWIEIAMNIVLAVNPSLYQIFCSGERMHKEEFPIPSNNII
jgi:hypothetical protein